MLATTTGDDGLRTCISVSAVLHLAILLLLYFGLPVFYTPLPEHHVPVPLEIVDIADITNTRIREPEQPTPPPAPAPAPPKPIEKVQAEPLPPPKPQPAETLTPEPKPKPKPKPPETKPKEDALASVLRDVSKLKEQPKTADQKTQTKDTEKTEQKSLAPALSDRLTISEEDALRRQVEQFWNVPIGARDVQNLVVEIVITVNVDRTVQSADVVDKSRMVTDPYFRSAAEAALRALDHFRYTPLELPEGKYDQWKTIDFTFDPRDML